MSNSDFGLIGLAVMGQNLVLNVESRGFHVSVYNRTTSTMEGVYQAGEACGEERRMVLRHRRGICRPA